MLLAGSMLLPPVILSKRLHSVQWWVNHKWFSLSLNIQEVCVPSDLGCFGFQVGPTKVCSMRCMLFISCDTQLARVVLMHTLTNY
jgi:hypothetical protein